MPTLPKASLEVVTPDGRRTVIPLAGRPLILGRAADCDVVIEEAFVSGHHARIEPSASGYVLRDAGSTNGTLLDGAPINGGKKLSDGSFVVLGRPGNYRLRFLAPGSPSSVKAAGARTEQNLKEVLEISKVLLSTLELEDVLGRVLDACLRVARAERGYLFLLEGGDLKLRASRDGAGGGTTEQQLEFSRSFARRVAETGEAEFFSDLDRNNSRDASESITRLRLQAVACVPLKIQQRVIGIAYLDSHHSTGTPDATGRDVVEVLAGLAAVAIENARLIQERVQNERWLALGRMAGSIVHDIRNPLAALRGTAELLAKKIADPRHEQKLRMMIREVDRLARLSGEMLVFSSGAQPLDRKPVSLPELVHEFLQSQEPRLEQEGIRLDAKLGEAVTLELDRQKLLRVLHNIVGNALDAMRPGGTLSVETARRAGRIILAISDTGCGMDQETAARIFEPFFTRGKDEGFGLGMATVKRLVEQHGAAISVESAPGSGTRVELAFPLPEPPNASR